MIAPVGGSPPYTSSPRNSTQIYTAPKKDLICNAKLVIYFLAESLRTILNIIIQRLSSSSFRCKQKNLIDFLCSKINRKYNMFFLLKVFYLFL